MNRYGGPREGRLELCAHAPADGYAFVQQGVAVLSVRPPLFVAVEVEADSIDKACKWYGFQRVSKQFDGLNDLVGYLKSEMVRAFKASGRPEPADVGRALMRHAPKSVLVRYLDRVAMELLPNKELQAAQDILESMLVLDSVQQDGVLYSRVLTLLAQTKRLSGEG